MFDYLTIISGIFRHGRHIAKARMNSQTVLTESVTEHSPAMVALRLRFSGPLDSHRERES